MAREIKLIEYELTDSTNLQARHYVSELDGKASEPVLFLAHAQTAGRGRLGRSFYSPADTGLYFSLLTSFPEKLEKILSLTALAAVAAAEQIESTFGRRVDIKWVNDLYLDSRKVAGILAESCVADTQRYIILGIGINLSTESFPDDLTIKAGSLGATDVTKETKRTLAKKICARLLDLLESDDVSAAMQVYRKRSCVIGKRIKFLQDGREISAAAIDVTDLGALVLKLDSGETLELSTGEISIFVQKEQI